MNFLHLSAGFRFLGQFSCRPSGKHLNSCKVEGNTKYRAQRKTKGSSFSRLLSNFPYVSTASTVQWGLYKVVFSLIIAGCVSQMFLFAVGLRRGSNPGNTLVTGGHLRLPQ